MKINPLSGYPSSSSYRNTIRPAAATHPAATTATTSAGTLHTPSFQGTLALATSSTNDVTYDFSHMTPNRMRAVAQELHKAGKIDPVQLFELQNAGVPLGKLGANGQLIPLTDAQRSQYADTQVNYLRIAQDAITFQEQSGMACDTKSTINEWKGILATLQSMQGQACSPPDATRGQL